MPRVIIEVSDAWLQRYKAGVDQAVDTLYGLGHQLDQIPASNLETARQLLTHVQAQLEDLRRNIEAWRIIF